MTFTTDAVLSAMASLTMISAGALMGNILTRAWFSWKEDHELDNYSPERQARNQPGQPTHVDTTSLASDGQETAPACKQEPDHLVSTAGPDTIDPLVSRVATAHGKVRETLQGEVTAPWANQKPREIIAQHTAAWMSRQAAVDSLVEFDLVEWLENIETDLDEALCGAANDAVNCGGGGPISVDARSSDELAADLNTTIETLASLVRHLQRCK